MVQAAAAGVVDFARADPHDHRWQLRLLVLLRQVERSNDIAWATTRILRDAPLQARSLAKDAFEALYKGLDDLERRAERHWFPWLGLKKSGVEDALAGLTEQWHRHWGDPADPEVAAKIEATVQALQAADLGRRKN